MKNKKKNKTNNKKLYIILAIVLVFVVGTFLALHYLKRTAPSATKQNNTVTRTNEGYISNDPATDEQKQAGEETKQSTIDNSGTTNTGSTTDLTITALNQADNTLYVRTLIQTVTASGTCNLSMSGPDGKTYSATVSVQAAASSTTCAGFNVPVSKLSTGDWTVTVTFTDNGTSATVSKGITIK